MSKKITLKEYNEIGVGTLRSWVKPLCNYSLRVEEWGDCTIYISLKKFYFILLFIPANLFYLFECMFTYGLKNFRFLSENFIQETLFFGTKEWKKAKELYEKG